MNWNLRVILMLIVIAMLGILVFQIFWITSTYDVHSRNFRQEVNETLREVMDQEIEDLTMVEIRRDSVLRARQIFTYQVEKDGELIAVTGSIRQQELMTPGAQPQETDLNLNDGNQLRLVDTIRVIEGKPVDLLDTTVLLGKQYKNPEYPGRVFLADPGDMDRIVNRVMTTLVASRPDMQHLRSAYQNLLQIKGIETPFEMAFFADSIMIEATQTNVDELGSPLAVQRIPGRGEFGELAVAWFPEKAGYVIKGMWMTFLASFLLICLVTLSFGLLLRTIFKQKMLSEIKNDFINNMTHELKTPIATVSAAMEALVNFNAISDPQRGFKYIDLSRKELKRLAGMVENVLTISTLEKQKLALEKESFDLCTLLSDTIQKFVIKDPERIVIQVDSLNSIQVYADKLHFQNVISNLIDNAIKYCKNDPLIHITCKHQNDYIVLVFKDNGIGISKEQQKHIFDKFYRVPTGDLHAVKGFGLGLSYVKQIVEAHGGSVGVISEEGVGSEFTIAIPDKS